MINRVLTTTASGNHLIGSAMMVSGVADATARVRLPGMVSEAQRALAAYRAELATLKTDMAAISGLDLPGVGEGMERRKSELEGLIDGIEAKLQSLGAVTVAPQVDASGPHSLTSSANEAAAALQRVFNLAGQANGAVHAVNNGMLRARSRNGFSDGETPGFGAE